MAPTNDPRERLMKLERELLDATYAVHRHEYENSELLAEANAAKAGTEGSSQELAEKYGVVKLLEVAMEGIRLGNELTALRRRYFEMRFTLESLLNEAASERHGGVPAEEP